MRAIGLLIVACATLPLAPALPRAAAQRARARVVVITSAGSTLTREAATHLRAELELLDVEVIEELGAESDLAPGASLARSRSALAAVVLLESGDHVVVWVDDAATEKLVARALPPGLAPTEVALRAVELLHASLLELDAHPPPAPEPEARALLSRTARPRPLDPAGMTLRAAVGLAGMVDGPGLTPRARIDVLGRIHPLFALGLVGAVNAPAAITSSFASAEVASAEVGAAAELRLAAGDVVAFDIGLRGSVLFVWGSGRSGDGLVPRADGTQALFLAGTFRVLIRPERSLGIFLDGEAGMSVPEVPLRFAGTPIGLAASPMLALSLGLELGIAP